jgi:hypothetical protein
LCSIALLTGSPLFWRVSFVGTAIGLAIAWLLERVYHVTAIEFGVLGLLLIATALVWWRIPH